MQDDQSESKWSDKTVSVRVRCYCFLGTTTERFGRNVLSDTARIQELNASTRMDAVLQNFSRTTSRTTPTKISTVRSEEEILRYHIIYPPLAV